MGKRLDLTGQKYGYLNIIGKAYTKRQGTYWNCKCDCGELTVVRQSYLTTNHTKSCGCYSKERTSEVNTKHGFKGTKLYQVWANMKTRCYNQKAENYKNYGARGIRVCNQWVESASRFLDWALNNGYKEGLQLDRINNDGNYYPGNCRFVTPKENSNNRRNSKKRAA